jgi:hypothetical protein
VSLSLGTKKVPKHVLELDAEGHKVVIFVHPAETPVVKRFQFKPVFFLQSPELSLPQSATLATIA